jgi:hypothetical protein
MTQKANFSSQMEPQNPPFQSNGSKVDEEKWMAGNIQYEIENRS